MMNYSREFFAVFLKIKRFLLDKDFEESFISNLKRLKHSKKQNCKEIEEGNGKPPMKTRTNSMTPSKVKKIVYLCKICMKGSWKKLHGR